MESMVSWPVVPFAVALGLVVAIAALEVVTLLFGVAASGLVDQLLPDWDVELGIDADVGSNLGVEGPDAGFDGPGMDGPGVEGPDLGVDGPDGGAAHGAGASGFATILGWLYVGRVPTLILFAAFLFGFGSSGYAIQWGADLVASPLPPWLAVFPASIAALPVVHLSGRFMYRWLPSEETDAVERASLVGQIAVVTLGTARRGEPAQAKLRDAVGQTHYVMVEPKGDEVIEAGEEAVLVRLNGSTYIAVRADMPDA